MLVATVTARSRGEAAQRIQSCLPEGAPFRFTVEGSAFARATIRMLAELENGNESGKRFELSPLYIPEPRIDVLRTAAAIPLGYVSTYGDIAAVAGTNARVVGGIMASNPLYPIVPCHRVVGSDMSLIGYGGRQSEPALRAKLERLRAEARGCDERPGIESAGGLRVFPVEWAIAKATRDGIGAGRQLSLW
jgi:O-6-methylguanine DNA methyltransferase